MRLTMAELKDWGQLIAWAVAVPAAIYTIYKGNKELHASTLQRSSELQWKQSNVAKELIAEIHHHRLAALAVEVMDRETVACDCELNAKKLRFNFDDAVAALKKAPGECDESDALIRDCFDWFFYYVDQIQHHIERKLISLEDVRHIFRPYAKKLARHREVHEAFMEFHDYDLARKFWAAYPEYRTSLTVNQASNSAAAGRSNQRS